MEEGHKTVALLAGLSAGSVLVYNYSYVIESTKQLSNLNCGCER